MEMLLCSSQKQNSSVVLHEPSASELLYHRGLLGPRHKPSQLFISSALSPTAALFSLRHPHLCGCLTVSCLLAISSSVPHFCPQSNLLALTYLSRPTSARPSFLVPTITLAPGRLITPSFELWLCFVPLLLLWRVFGKSCVTHTSGVSW